MAGNTIRCRRPPWLCWRKLRCALEVREEPEERQQHQTERFAGVNR